MEKLSIELGVQGVVAGETSISLLSLGLAHDICLYQTHGFFHISIFRLCVHDITSRSFACFILPNVGLSAW